MMWIVATAVLIGLTVVCALIGFWAMVIWGILVAIWLVAMEIRYRRA